MIYHNYIIICLRVKIEVYHGINAQNRQSAKNEKPGSIGKSTLPGVEAGSNPSGAPVGHSLKAKTRWGLKRPDKEPVALCQRKTGGSPGLSIEASSGLKRKQYPLCRPRLRIIVSLVCHGLSKACAFRILPLRKQQKKHPEWGAFLLSKWRDSNPRPFGPEPNALPSCATPRYEWSR